MAKVLAKCLLHDQLMHPTDYLAAVELKGRDVTLTIATVQFEDLQMQGGKKERKPVLSFNGTKKKLVVNKTNADSIAQMYGTKADEWPGKRITLYPTMTMVGRKQEPCIRVRETVPGAKVVDAPPAEPTGMSDEEKQAIIDAEREQG